MELTKEQKELQQAVKEYEQQFGEKYAVAIGEHKSVKEMLQEVKSCLATNTPQQEPDYMDDAIY